MLDVNCPFHWPISAQRVLGSYSAFTMCIVLDYYIMLNSLSCMEYRFVLGGYNFSNWMFLLLLTSIVTSYSWTDSTISFIKCRLKIFVPIAFLAFAVMVPVNWTNGTLELQHSTLDYSDIDKLSISNIPNRSPRYAELSVAFFCILFILYIFLMLSWWDVIDGLFVD